MFDHLPTRSRSNSTPLPAFIRKRRPATTQTALESASSSELSELAPPRPPRNPARPQTTASSVAHDGLHPPRPSHASSSFLSSDNILLRRNKSTGSRMTRSRISSSFSTPHSNIEHLHLDAASASIQSSAQHTTCSPLSMSRAGSTSHLPRFDVQTPRLLASSSGPPSPKRPQVLPPTQKQQQSQFSTADRTILEELKRSLSARDAQFTRKSVTRAKHHPYSPHEVPYPRNYARDVVDLDVWETATFEQMSGSLTFHDFDYPPTKVLDIGCGTGAWILNCARSWRNCHFVGLDIVPLHPDLQRVGSLDLASRITWVQTNFLDGLPFPNEEFDFVHIKRIARGVPENKWDFLLEEITRVMKPDASFEMIEEDIFFPTIHQYMGGPDNDMARLHDSYRQSPSDSWNTVPANSRPVSLISNVPVAQHPDGNRLGNTPRQDMTAQGSQKALHMRRSHETRPQLVRARSASAAFTGQLHPLRPAASHIVEEDSLQPQTIDNKSVSTSALPLTVSIPQSTSLKSPVTSTPLLRTLPCVPSNPSDHTVLERIYTEMHASRLINLAPLSLLPDSLAMHFRDVHSHPPILIEFPSRVSERRRDESQPVLLRIRTRWESDSDSDGAREAIHPLKRRSRMTLSTDLSNQDGPTPQPTMRARKNLEAIQDDWASVQDLLNGIMPYPSQDDQRMSAYTLSTRASFPSSAYSTFPASSAESKTSLESIYQSDEKHDDGGRIWSDKGLLARRRANLDPRTLNLHLALRMAEVLACAEAMWEWVMESQKKRRQCTRTPVPARSRAGSVDVFGARAPGSVVIGASPGDDEVMEAICELTRADFEVLLTKFEQDIRQHMGIGKILRDEYQWTNIRLPPTTDDKAYDDAWEEWEEFERRHEAKHRHHQREPPARDHPAVGQSLLPDPNMANNIDGVVAATRASRRELRPSALEASHLLREMTDGASSQRLCRSLRVFTAWKA